MLIVAAARAASLLFSYNSYGDEKNIDIIINITYNEKICKNVVEAPRKILR